MILTDIHCRVGLAVVFFAFALGVWGVIAFLRGMGVSGSYFGALVIGEILIIGQALVGGLLLVSGNFPVDGLHILYGIVIPLSWAAVYIYTRGAQTQREMMIYAVMSFIVMGLGIRGIMTGGAMPVCLPF
jgi:hypothetical protein